MLIWGVLVITLWDKKNLRTSELTVQNLNASKPCRRRKPWASKCIFASAMVTNKLGLDPTNWGERE